MMTHFEPSDLSIQRRLLGHSLNPNCIAPMKKQHRGRLSHNTSHTLYQISILFAYYLSQVVEDHASQSVWSCS